MTWPRAGHMRGHISRARGVVDVGFEVSNALLDGGVRRGGRFLGNRSLDGEPTQTRGDEGSDKFEQAIHSRSTISSINTMNEINARNDTNCLISPISYV